MYQTIYASWPWVILQHNAEILVCAAHHGSSYFSLRQEQEGQTELERQGRTQNHDKSTLPGKFKARVYQTDLSTYEIPISLAEKLDQSVSNNMVRKLDLPIIECMVDQQSFRYHWILNSGNTRYQKQDFGVRWDTPMRESAIQTLEWGLGIRGQ